MPRWRGRASLRLVILTLILALVLGACGSEKMTPAAATSEAQLRGISAEAQGHTAEALSDYRAALKSDPLSSLAYYDIGVVYQHEGDAIDARTNYQKALVIDLIYQSALYNLAIVDTPTDPATAVSLYDQLLGRNAQDATALFNLGLLLSQTGQSAAGDADVAKAIKQDPVLASRVPASVRTPAAATTPTARP
jgi:tetratricopeptide (TPR) repeat protein